MFVSTKKVFQESFPNRYCFDEPSFSGYLTVFFSSKSVKSWEKNKFQINQRLFKDIYVDLDLKQDVTGQVSYALFLVSKYCLQLQARNLLDPKLQSLVWYQRLFCWDQIWLLWPPLYMGNVKNVSFLKEWYTRCFFLSRDVCIIFWTAYLYTFIL